MTDWKVGQRVEAIKHASQPLAHAKSPLRTRRWGLFNARRYREADVSERIGELGYLTYVPQFKISVRDKTKHRKFKEVMRSTFPGYGFVEFSPSIDPWGDIERVRGMVEIVKVGGEPGYVSALLVEELRKAESGNFDQAYRTDGATCYAPGDRLMVTDGPFKWSVVEFVANLTPLDDDGRITALLDAFARKTLVELQADQVERE